MQNSRPDILSYSPEQLHMKVKESRQTPIIAEHSNVPFFEDDVYEGEVFSTIEDEFNSLQRLHDIAPGHVPEPVATLENSDEVYGFLIERIEGYTLAEYIDEDIGTPGADRTNIVDTLRGLSSEFYEHGEVHGDFGAQNIIMNGETPVLVDPVGYPRDYRHIEDAHDYEKFQLEMIDHELKHSVF